jgi:hypothetical protein
MPANLINAFDLDTWARSAGAKPSFPHLVRRLVAASVEPTASIDIRTDEGVAYAGWDGKVESDQPTYNVPRGSSGWEFGCDEGVTTKANDDYRKRTDDPLGLDRASATFVFATPRRWSRKQAWIEEKQAEGHWKQVVAYDADDLALWLERLYGVHVWATGLLGRHTGGVDAIDQWLETWSKLTAPRITPAMILAGRTEVVEKIKTWIDGDAPELNVIAGSADEACAVVAAAVDGLSFPQNEQIKARMFRLAPGVAPVIDVQGTKPCVVMSSQVDSDVARRIVGAGHRLILLNGPRVGDDERFVDVQKLDPRPLSGLLVAAGRPERDAGRLAALARRSFVSFRREIARTPGSLASAWSNPADAMLLAPVLFAQAWRSDCEADRAVIAELAGISYDAIEARLAVLSSGDDPPIRRGAGGWSFISVLDVWRQVHRHLSTVMLQRLEAVAIRVLSEVDPKYDLPPDQRWYASILGQNRKHSPQLRAGLADSMAFIAAFGHRVPSACSYPPEAIAASVSRRLLEDSNGNERLWFALADVIEEIAEAAPGGFLSACERDLASATPVLPRMYVVSSTSFMSSSPHVQLLWALEKLAWSPAYLSRSATVLAKLAEGEPDGNFGNKASRSLRDIFLTWMPHTSSTIPQMIEALDVIRSRSPKHAWTLMTSLLWSGHDSTSGTSRPKWAAWAPIEAETPPHDQQRMYLEAIVKRLQDDAATDLIRLGTLICRINSLPPATVDALYDRLFALDPAPISPANRKAFSDDVREYIARNVAHPDADWALPQEELIRLNRLLSRFEPEDPVLKCAWLFKHHVDLPDSHQEDYHLREKAVQQARVSALREIVAGGIPLIARFAKAVDVPRFVGSSIAHADYWDKGQDDAILRLLADEDVAVRGMAGGLSWTRYQQGLIDWLRATLIRLRSVLDDESLVTVALEADVSPEVWALVDSFGDSVSRSYWLRIHAFYIRGEIAVEAAERLLSVGRALSAVCVLGEAVGHDRCAPVSEIVLRTLRAACVAPAGQEKVDHSHFGWILGKLLDYALTKAPDAVEEIAKVEWSLLPSLRKDYYEGNPKALHQLLERSPAFFVEVVSVVYRGERDPAVTEAEVTEEGKLRGRRAHELLDGWRGAPGQRDDGSVDLTRCVDWVDEARRLLRESGRADIGDLVIGQVISGCPSDADGCWPCEPIRDLIERVSSDSFERGIANGLYNGRGMTSRGMFDGGDQERSTASRYQRWADQVMVRHPRVAELLRSISSSYHRDAGMHDRDADARLDGYG